MGSTRKMGPIVPTSRKDDFSAPNGSHSLDWQLESIGSIGFSTKVKGLDPVGFDHDEIAYF